MPRSRGTWIRRALSVAAPLILAAAPGVAAELEILPIHVGDQEIVQAVPSGSGGALILTEDALRDVAPGSPAVDLERASAIETLHPSEDGSHYGVLLHRQGAADLAPCAQFTVRTRTGAERWSIGATEDVTFRVSATGSAAGMRLNINDAARNSIRFYDDRGARTAEHVLPHLTGGSFSLEGGVFLALCATTGLHAFDAAGTPLWVLPGVRLFDADPTGSLVAVSGDGWAGLARSGEIVGRVSTTGLLVRRVAVAPDGSRFGIATKHEIRVFRGSDGSPLFQVGTGDDALSFTGLDLAGADGWCVAGLARDLGPSFSVETRHPEGEVRAYDASGTQRHSASMRFSAWNIWTPTPILDPSGRGCTIVTRRAVYRTVLP